MFGLGYVDTVAAAGLAQRGHKVVGLDVDASKVAAINAGRSMSRSVSLVNTGGNAGLRGIVFELIAWKTARFRVVQAGLYRPTATIYKC